MAKLLYEAKRRRRNSGAWGVARNTLIRFRFTLRPNRRRLVAARPGTGPNKANAAGGNEPGQFRKATLLRLKRLRAPPDQRLPNGVESVRLILIEAFRYV
jgi:hypothetical protein